MDLVRTGNFACVEGPYRLISNDYLLPLGLVQFFLDRLELRVENFFALFWLVFLQVLADTVNDTNVLRPSLYYLCRDDILRFAKMPPPLVVADECPLDLVVCQLLCWNFSCMVVWHRMSTQILRPYLNMIHYPSLGQIEMQHARQYYKVQLVCVIFEIIYKIGHDVSHKICRSVAFPVGNYAVSSVTLSYLGF